jgi:hypothetical protein
MTSTRGPSSSSTLGACSNTISAGAGASARGTSSSSTLGACSNTISSGAGTRGARTGSAGSLGATTYCSRTTTLGAHGTCTVCSGPLLCIGLEPAVAGLTIDGAGATLCIQSSTTVMLATGPYTTIGAEGTLLAGPVLETRITITIGCRGALVIPSAIEIPVGSCLIHSWACLHAVGIIHCVACDPDGERTHHHHDAYDPYRGTAFWFTVISAGAAAIAAVTAGVSGAARTSVACSACISGATCVARTAC